MKSFRFILVALSLAAASTPAFALPYDQVREQNVVVPLQSMAHLRANLKELSGRAIEIDGEVTGIMTQGSGRVALLRIGDEMAVLSAPPTLEPSHLLSAGTLVRVLARLEDDGRTGVLTILAMTEGIAPTPVARAGDAAEIKAADINGSLQSTPMTTTTIGSLPQPPGVETPDFQAPDTDAPRRTPAPAKPVAKSTVKSLAAKPVMVSPAKLSTGDREEIIEAQVPAYAAIVRRHNKKLKPEVVEEIATAILRAGFKHNLDPRFLAAIIAVESDFDVYCLSKSGAMGLGQLMPFNLKEAGVKNAWNPTENIMGCAKLLRGHLDDYKSRANSTLLAVAAYNAGPGAVRRAGYKVPNGAQVQRYVWKVYYRYKAFAPDMF